MGRRYRWPHFLTLMKHNVLVQCKVHIFVFRCTIHLTLVCAPRISVVCFRPCMIFLRNMQRWLYRSQIFRVSQDIACFPYVLWFGIQLVLQVFEPRPWAAACRAGFRNVQTVSAEHDPINLGANSLKSIFLLLGIFPAALSIATTLMYNPYKLQRRWFHETMSM